MSGHKSQQPPIQQFVVLLSTILFIISLLLWLYNSYAAYVAYGWGLLNQFGFLVYAGSCLGLIISFLTGYRAKMTRSVNWTILFIVVNECLTAYLIYFILVYEW